MICIETAKQWFRDLRSSGKNFKEMFLECEREWEGKIHGLEEEVADYVIGQIEAIKHLAKGWVKWIF